MKQLQALLEAKREERVRLCVEIENIISRLRSVCDHSKLEPYTWEHDNGYGRQKDITGSRCSYCGFMDFWNTGRFINPLEIG